MKRCEEVVPLLGPLHDGALAEDDRAWVEDHVRGCPSCQDRLALIAAQGRALRSAIEARASELDLSRLADRVMARAANERSGFAGRAPVWGREMWWAHRGAFAAGSGLALAACIAAAVIFLPSRADEIGLLADNSPQVEEVDFGTHDGAVLQLPRQTTVIWMSDDRAVQR
jgi:anti-sigma factor RsiW